LIIVVIHSLIFLVLELILLTLFDIPLVLDSVAVHNVI
jgi:hypothetical protein